MDDDIKSGLVVVLVVALILVGIALVTDGDITEHLQENLKATYRQADRAANKADEVCHKAQEVENKDSDVQFCTDDTELRAGY